MSDLLIRPAKPDDYDAIVSVWQSAGLPIKPAGRDTRAAIENQLMHFPTTYLLAEFDGKVVGVILGTHDGRKGWINRLAVHADHQGRGIARRLISACESALADLGIKIVAALVEAENDASSALFQSCGYKGDVPVRYFRKLHRPDV